MLLAHPIIIRRCIALQRAFVSVSAARVYEHPYRGFRTRCQTGRALRKLSVDESHCSRFLVRQHRSVSTCRARVPLERDAWHDARLGDTWNVPFTRCIALKHSDCKALEKPLFHDNRGWLEDNAGWFIRR